VPTKNVTFRVTPDERAALTKAAGALDINVSQLAEIACVEQAHRLGFYDGVDSPVRVKPGHWKDAPSRRHSEVSATDRLTISMNPVNLGLIQRAAQQLEVVPSAFIVGCMFRYLAKKKKELPDNKKLSSAALPEQYDD
jgi:uncharacterized protein (DUF1778 family)